MLAWFSSFLGMRWDVGRILLPHAWSSRVPVFSSSLSSHHLVRRGRSFSSSSGVVSSFPGVLSSHRMRVSCGGRRAFLIRPLSHSRMRWGKRRKIGFPAHRFRMPPGFSFLFSSCRLVGASRAVSLSWLPLVAGAGSCGSARWRLVVAEASFVCPAAWRYACPHPLSVVSSASRPSVSYGVSLLVPHVLRAGAAGRACLSRLICSSRAAGRGVRSSSRFSSRGASRWRVVIDDVPVAVAWRACGSRGFVSSHRLVKRGDFGFSSHLGGERMGRGSRHAVSGLVLACLDAVGGWWQCRSRHRRSRLLPIILWLRGVGL